MSIFVARKCGKIRPFRTTFLAIWQVGVLTAERSIFWAQNWPFSAVLHRAINEKPGNVYFCSAKMRQIRPFRTTFQAIWQIGVLTAERSILGAQNWPFSAVSHWVINEKPGNVYFCSAKMRQISTVSQYVSSYLANWRSYCRTEHFWGPKMLIFGRFALRFKRKTGKCLFF